MSFGPGKYDELCTWVRQQAEARGVILVVIDGKEGEGFSAQLSPLDTMRMPSLLRIIADQIEADWKTFESQKP